MQSDFPRPDFKALRLQCLLLVLALSHLTEEKKRSEREKKKRKELNIRTHFVSLEVG